MESYEYTLPVEQWRQILANVSLGDLCSVVLTSRHMNSVASLPELWAGMKVNLEKVMENGLAEFYNINRFKKVKRLTFDDWTVKENTCTCEEWERLLKEIPRSPLEDVNFSGASSSIFLSKGSSNLSLVSAEILASAISHLHIVNFNGTGLTTDQCVELLKASYSSTTLSTLDLAGINLSEVPAHLLASSISKLKDVNLSGTHLTKDQCVALLEASLFSKSLTNLYLQVVNLSEVPAELLATSISRLCEVGLRSTDLTPDQCITLLNASLSSTTLTHVNLMDVRLSQVPAELLAKSISRLYDVILVATCLETDQCIALLNASLSSTTLTKLILGQVGLSKVPSELLASSISRLKDVNLSYTWLTTDQCISVLKAILSSTTLTKVDLSSVNLGEVPIELLARSISRLEEVKLRETGLTTDQSIALLKAIPSNTTLRRIYLGVNKIKMRVNEYSHVMASVPAHVKDRLR